MVHSIGDDDVEVFRLKCGAADEIFDEIGQIQFKQWTYDADLIGFIMSVGLVHFLRDADEFCVQMLGYVKAVACGCKIEDHVISSVLCSEYTIPPPGIICKILSLYIELFDF